MENSSADSNDNLSDDAIDNFDNEDDINDDSKDNSSRVDSNNVPVYRNPVRFFFNLSQIFWQIGLILVCVLLVAF